jgi:hypothetical protein
MRSIGLIFFLFNFSFLGFSQDLNSAKDSISFKDNKKTYYDFLIKLNAVSPLFGHTQFGIEKQISKNNSIEFSFSFIGAGVSSRAPISINNYPEFRPYLINDKNQYGFSFGAGYRVYLNREIKGNNKTAPFLGGFYLKPSIYLGGFSYDEYNIRLNSFLFAERKNVLFAALMLEPGLQLSVTKNFYFDIHAGVGYSFDNLNSKSATYREDLLSANTSGKNAFLYSVLRVSQTSPGLALNGGIKLGWRLNRFSIKKNK